MMVMTVALDKTIALLDKHKLKQLSYHRNQRPANEFKKGLEAYFRILYSMSMSLLFSVHQSPPFSIYCTPVPCHGK